MTDRDLLLELSKDIREIKHGMQSMSDDIHKLKDDVQELKELKDDVQMLKDEVHELKELKDEVHVLKDEVHVLRENVQASDVKLTALSLTIENVTNRNIQILAENHLNVIDKVNAAVQVQDKSLIHEVQISGLQMRVDRLEGEVELLKKQAL